MLLVKRARPVRAVMRTAGCLVLCEDVSEWLGKTDGRETTNGIWSATGKEGANEEASAKEFSHAFQQKWNQKWNQNLPRGRGLITPITRLEYKASTGPPVRTPIGRATAPQFPIPAFRLV